MRGVLLAFVALFFFQFSVAQNILLRLQNAYTYQAVRNVGISTIPYKYLHCGIYFFRFSTHKGQKVHFKIIKK